jgi:5-methylcytosine-specific restriction endonuclease McrA
MQVMSRKEARAAGLVRYSSGVPCKNGHAAERQVSNNVCVECGAERVRQSRIESPEAWRGYGRKAYAKNPEIMRERTQRQRDKNPEITRERCRKWFAANPEYSREYHEANAAQRRASGLVWRLENKDKISEKDRKWRTENPDKHAAKERNRRSRKRLAEGLHTADDVKGLHDQQKGKCACCGVKLGNRYHVDHIVPLFRGGTNWPNNLQLLCAPCNLSKGAKDPIEFMQSRGRLL